MKRIAYSFLLIFLLSCGSQSDLQRTTIRVQFRDTLTAPDEYYLLSVRDTALVVEPGFYGMGNTPRVIPFSQINRVFHDNGGKTSGFLLGGLIGCSAVLIPAAIFGATHNVGGGEGLAIGGALISIPAMVAGGIIGCALAEGEKEYAPSSNDTLRSFAKYPDTEPPELQKIK